MPDKIETLVINKKARHEYAIDLVVVAGMQLTGAEVKSLRNKAGSLAGSFVKIVAGEAVLVNAQITPYKFASNDDYDPRRNRKLLLKRKELNKLAEKLGEKRWTLVPLRIMTMGKYIKLEVGVGKGLKEFEKREKIKKREQQRELARFTKHNW